MAASGRPFYFVAVRPDAGRSTRTNTGFDMRGNEKTEPEARFF